MAEEVGCAQVSGTVGATGKGRGDEEEGEEEGDEAGGRIRRKWAGMEGDETKESETIEI